MSAAAPQDPIIQDAAHAVRDIDIAARLAGWLYKHRGTVWAIVAAFAGVVGTAGTMLARHEARIVRLEEHRESVDARQGRLEAVLERVEVKVDRALEGQARIEGYFQALPPHRRTDGADEQPRDRSSRAAPAPRRSGR